MMFISVFNKYKFSSLIDICVRSFLYQEFDKSGHIRFVAAGLKCPICAEELEETCDCCGGLL
jgi:hypothetical protein